VNSIAKKLRVIEQTNPGLDNKLAISVVGLGYVGAVSMACLASLGHRMVGVDVATEKVTAIKLGRSPIVEAQLGELLAKGVASGRINATQNLVAAVLETDTTFLSVGTPTADDGSCDLSYVRTASHAIGQALAQKDAFHTIVLRCSVPPGTTLDVVAVEIAKASGKTLGRDFGVAFNPEFLREGVAVADFFAPPKTVIGASDTRTEALIARIFSSLDADVIITTIAAAEMVKYVDNVWHATKVVFGNEVGRLCKAIDLDSHTVMDIFVKDLKLNLSPYYLKPGHAFGGSCLPKEVRAVMQLANIQNLELPLIESLLRSNACHLQHAADLLAPFRGKRVGFLGLTFKAATDDVRESPTLDLMAKLAADGWSLTAYDPHIGHGAEAAARFATAASSRPELKGFLDGLPYLLQADAVSLVAAVDVVVVTHATNEYRSAIATRSPDVHVLDLARLFPKPPRDSTYTGIAW
jgi:GDP-mannose 6-dehydrogenase